MAVRILCSRQLEGNTDVQSQRDASKVTYAELSVRQEMKRRWSGRLGDEFPAPGDTETSGSFSSAAEGGRRLLETAAAFKLGFQH